MRTKIETVRRFALKRDRLAGSESLQFTLSFRCSMKSGERSANIGTPRKMIFESAAAVGLVELRAKDLF